MSDAWNSNQIEMVLRSVVNRLHANRKSFNIKVENDKVTISNLNIQNHIYISLSPGRVWISLSTYSGSYEPSVFPWKDKGIKALIKELYAISDTAGETSQAALLKAFPEAITEEFEQHVLLEAKDGKSES